MDIHNHLGPGFKEIIYKDALVYEFEKGGIPFSREVPYKVPFKDTILPRPSVLDFLIFDSIILEVKASIAISNAYVNQTLNYLKASGKHLGIIANFGAPSFEFRRVLF